MMLTIDADVHYPIMELSPEDRRDRAKVNEAGNFLSLPPTPPGITTQSGGHVTFYKQQLETGSVLTWELADDAIQVTSEKCQCPISPPVAN
jgi:hypothetical protein